MLLFGANRQRYHRTAERKCVHSHGGQYRRPFFSSRFVPPTSSSRPIRRAISLARQDQSHVGTRAESLNQAPAACERRPTCIGEAIVNAIAHRDYNSNASVEVRLLADRLEAWNPA
ncbi:MAG: hypothetical protein IPN98_16865 [Propionivibrio sp.]|nr:hypothetical protein [Propionivibrio sp.]